jgi:hypothetical protein
MTGFSLNYAHTDRKVGGQCVVEHVIVQLRETFDLPSSCCWEKIFTTEQVCDTYSTWKEERY